MDVIISEKQEDRFRNIIINLVEDLNVPLAGKIDIQFESTVYVIVELKSYLGSTPRTKYESLIRNRIHNYLGLNVHVIMYNI
jgi:hypothetical protein